MRLSAEPVRHFHRTQLGVPLPPTSLAAAEADDQPPVVRAELPTLPADHPLLATVKALRADGFAGVILSGPPGTSKTYFARRLASTLCDRVEQRISFVQFHPSYQYEDFIEGYQPQTGGGYAPTERVFLQLCALARDSEELHVLVIDELSRSDAVRVFGEALTYLEASQRDIEFELASGRLVAIPKNLFIIATMNPWDRGVDELDMAFERRFAKIDLDPDEAILAEILTANGLPEDLRGRVIEFFRRVQRLNDMHARIGHAYFSRVRDADGLRRLWNHQLSQHFRRAFRLAPQEFDTLRAAWDVVIAAPAAPAAAPA